MSYQIYSTLTATTTYNFHNYDLEKNPILVKSITIKGGANVAFGKRSYQDTKFCYSSEVTDEEMALLEKDSVFQTHVENGFITYTKAKVNPESVAADMETRDASAPLVEQDFEEKTKDDNKDSISFNVSQGKAKKK